MDVSEEVTNLVHETFYEVLKHLDIEMGELCRLELRKKHLILPLDYTLYWEGIYLGECGTSAHTKNGLKLL